MSHYNGPIWGQGLKWSNSQSHSIHILILLIQTKEAGQHPWQMFFYERMNRLGHLCALFSELEPLDMSFIRMLHNPQMSVCIKCSVYLDWSLNELTL